MRLLRLGLMPLYSYSRSWSLGFLDCLRRRTSHPCVIAGAFAYALVSGLVRLHIGCKASRFYSTSDLYVIVGRGSRAITNWQGSWERCGLAWVLVSQIYGAFDWLLFTHRPPSELMATAQGQWDG